MSLVNSQPTAGKKLNTMREYLQAYILRILQGQGFFRSAAFVGGTAIRFLHQLPRYSEGLDFSTLKKKPVDFAPLLKTLKNELHLAGYDISITYKDTKVVQNAFVGFSGLMFETGLSPRPLQQLSVKIEIDSNPPAGAKLETAVLNQYFPLAFVTHDIPSLLAGKIYALLSRRYLKGRDFFDLGWYLSRWPKVAPNIKFLRNALLQTKWTGPLPDENNWREIIRRIVSKADWKRVHNDVANFLERPDDLNVFTKKNVLGLIG